ncbi:hypothetical protein AADZ86_09815 [Colwelliaceae bacterium BS250]
MNTLLIKRTFISTLALTLSLLIIIFSAEAQNNESKNQHLKVTIGPNNCVTAVTNTSANNCATDYPADKNPCKGKSECVCMKKEKNIIWTATKTNKIEIKFASGSPFNHQCTLKSATNKIDCKVKNTGSFEYEVYAEGCAGKPYDPRIVVQ